MNTRARTLRNTLFSSVGLYTEYVLGMLTSIIIARLLAPDGFGTYSLVIWLVGMGVATTNSGTASAAIKFIAELRASGQSDRIPALLRWLRRAQHIFLVLVMIAGGVVFLRSGAKVAPGLNHLLLLGFLEVAVILRSSYMLNIGICKGFENFRGTALVALVATPLNLLMVLAAWWMHAGVQWLLAVFVVSSVAFYAMSQMQVSRLVPTPKETGPHTALPPPLVTRVRRHMWFAAAIVTFGFFVASEVEVLFLNLFTGNAAAGQFKVGYQLATGAALLVPGVFGAILLPMMAGALSQGREVAARRFVATTGYLWLLAMPLVAFGFVFADDVIRLLYGVAYAPASLVFALCLAAAAISTATQGGSSLLVSADRQDSVLLRVVVCGLFKVALDIVLIRRYGLHGAAIAYLCGSLAASITTMALAIRVGQAQPEWGRLSRIAAAGVLAGLIALPIGRGLVPLAAILVGGFVLAIVYVTLTLLLRCWTADDIEHLEALHRRYAAGRPRIGAQFLAWARRHAAHAQWSRT